MQWKIYLQGQQITEKAAHISPRALAKLAVTRDMAKVVGQNAVQLTRDIPWGEIKRLLRHTVVTSQPVKCGQGATYESAGSEKFPKVHLGGLTRTENRPAPIKKFQAARVPH